jgi:excisionase family DNA binding protein
MSTPLELLTQEDVRRIVREELRAAPTGDPGFLDVNGAAEYLSSTPGAIRQLVNRGAIPVHRAPTGRLLFDRDELRAWVESGDAA